MKQGLLGLAVGALAVMFLSGNLSYAQVGGGQINACAEKDGEIYLVGRDFKEKKCKKGDVAVSWNVMGPQGEPGQAGLAGPQGLEGPQGPAGENGDDEVSIPCLKIVGNDVIFEGCNVVIRSGAGTTSANPNGLGNLIIGYDENDGTDSKTGSHNLVIGANHTYMSYGGFIAGFNNKVSGSYSTVTGGKQNIAEGLGSWVGGGEDNWAMGDYSSVSGGAGGVVNGDYSSILGGNGNNIDIDAFYSTVSGGLSNFIGGSHASIGGGQDNVANGEYSSVSGGEERMVTGSHDWQAGGLFEDL